MNNEKYINTNNIENFATITSTSASYAAGEKDTWTVPVNVYQATFTVIGGKGGNSKGTSEGTSTQPAQIITKKGGFGANITATLPVLPGTTYSIYVGNNGTDSNANSAAAGGKSSDLNNTYDGGNAQILNNNTNGGGGGAASYITKVDSTPIIIAGGGGGGGYKNDGNSSGDLINSILISSSGKGTTAKNSSGGGGGGGNPGGDGGDNSATTTNGGGAGGSYVISTALTKTNIADTTGIPSIIITWEISAPTSTPVASSTAVASVLGSILDLTEAPTTTKAPTTTQSPTTTNPLIPILKQNTDKLNDLRFNWIEHQQRLDDITKRINDAKLNMVSLTSTPAAYSAEGALTFY